MLLAFVIPSSVLCEASQSPSMAICGHEERLLVWNAIGYHEMVSQCAELGGRTGHNCLPLSDSGCCG